LKYKKRKLRLGGKVKRARKPRTQSAAQKVRNEEEYLRYSAEMDKVHIMDPMPKGSKVEI
jgi:hypothetical protein